MYFALGMVLEAGYAHTDTRAHERPQGSSFYVITPDGRDGNYFVRTTQKARRDQFLVNLFTPVFHAAGTHQVKTGVDVDVVCTSPRMHFGRGLRITTVQEGYLAAPRLPDPVFWRFAMLRHLRMSLMCGGCAPKLRWSTAFGRIGTSWCADSFFLLGSRSLTLRSEVPTRPSLLAMQ